MIADIFAAAAVVAAAEVVVADEVIAALTAGAAAGRLAGTAGWRRTLETLAGACRGRSMRSERGGGGEAPVPWGYYQPGGRRGKRRRRRRAIARSLRAGIRSNEGPGGVKERMENREYSLHTNLKHQTTGPFLLRGVECSPSLGHFSLVLP